MPNRIIKESICSSEKIASLSDFEFRVWVALITQADDAGRGDARPAIIRGRAFPLRDRVTVKDIDAAVHALAAKGCISLYTVGGKSYFWFPSWSEHQRIRDCKPKYPGPEEADSQSLETCGELRQPAASCGELRQPAALIQSNPNPNPESESNPNNTIITNAPAREEALGRVMSAYLDKIDPLPSERCRGELEGYCRDMGAEVCLRAIDRAMDAGATSRNWNYIRAILRSLSQQGVKCLSDWDALEDERGKTQDGPRTREAPARNRGGGKKWNLEYDNLDDPP